MVKSNSSPQRQDLFELLKSLRSLQVEYPVDLLAARRAAFISQIEEYNAKQAEEDGAETQLRTLLHGLKSAEGDYPPELQSAQRAAFLEQIRQHNETVGEAGLASEEQVINTLTKLKTVVEEYPADLLAARRAAFIAQVNEHTRAAEEQEDRVFEDRTILRLFARLKRLDVSYPTNLWAARRADFIAQIRETQTSVLDALRLAVQGLFRVKDRLFPVLALPVRGPSWALAGLAVAILFGMLLFATQVPGIQTFNTAESDLVHLPPAATDTLEPKPVRCKPGYQPPLCLVREAERIQDALTYPGNGNARPAVAKDTHPGNGSLHRAAHVNDGLYGPGASWISNSAYSWIKIDLGKVSTINTITFGRDRLGQLNDGDPGQFVIAVALDDNVYADGNSDNDLVEYWEVFDSKDVDFDGVISGAETIKASFKPTRARFVKITFENPGTAVDEIEAFMIEQPGFVSSPTQRPRENESRPTLTPIPTTTSTPSRTPTARPTLTPSPTWTPTSTRTPTPRPTNTATPTPTHTPTDVPTDTPAPTNTPVPTDTSTPTNTPAPTDTPVPPTNTLAPSHTSEPTSTPAATNTQQMGLPQTEIVESSVP